MSRSRFSARFPFPPRISAILGLMALAAALGPFARSGEAATPKPPAARKSAARKLAPKKKSPGIPLDAATVNDPGLVSPVGPGSSGGAVLRAQVLLARAHFSCGEIDARYGENLKRAVAAFQKSRDLPETGTVDEATWKALDADAADILVTVPTTPEDVAGPFVPLPQEMMEKAALPALGFTSALEGLAEKYHASPDLLRRLNPGATFDSAGQTLTVINVLVPAPGKAAEVVVSRSDSSVTARDAEGKTIARYPASTGSDHDPLPIGRWKILGVSRNPDFHYNPQLFWDAKSTDRKTRLAPGPNNPVGVAWIDLSKPHYGIHGSPEPSRIGKTQSHGCIRMTNWDVWELQQMVSPGMRAVLED